MKNKEELTFRTLHEKTDNLLPEQWSRTMKIQDIQLDMLEDLSKEIKK